MNKWWTVVRAAWTIFSALKKTKKTQHVQEIVDVVDAVVKGQEKH